MNIATVRGPLIVSLDWQSLPILHHRSCRSDSDSSSQHADLGLARAVPTAMRRQGQVQPAGQEYANISKTLRADTRSSVKPKQRYQTRVTSLLVLPFYGRWRHRGDFTFEKRKKIFTFLVNCVNFNSTLGNYIGFNNSATSTEYTVVIITDFIHDFRTQNDHFGRRVIFLIRCDKFRWGNMDILAALCP